MDHNILSKFIKNEYVFSIITKFISIAIGIVQSVLLARYLGAELKGVNAYISSIVSIGGIVITFGMHQAYPYFRKKYGKDQIYKQYVSLIIVMYFVYLMIGIFCTIILPVTYEIKAVLILIPIYGYSRITGYVALVETPNTRNKWWTIISFIDIVYILILWLFVKRNIFWGISILAFAELCKCVSFTLILRVKPKLEKNMLQLLIELAKYGFFPMVALLMTTLNYRIDVLMLHHYNYITDAMIGVYSLGLSLSDKIVMIPDTLKGVLVSRLAKGADEREVAKVSRIGFWASLLFCILIFLLGKVAIHILYGNEYQGAYSIVLITSFGVLAVSYFKLIAQYNIVNKKQILNIYMLSIAIVVDVVFNLFFIPLWGIQGAALATSFGNFVCGIVFVLYFCKKSGLSVKEMMFLQKSDIESLKKAITRKERLKK